VLREFDLEGELRSGFDLCEPDDPARDAREFVLLLREHGILSREDHSPVEKA
jgi:hypothetical protein